ncbi:MAG: type II toxin-antitoxin system death-on-curing family toxin [Oscillospiraceae bacterium]|nr:type II toxin-antitoxin system death-on-curing family toxin [Ruminococcus sp.]
MIQHKAAQLAFFIISNHPFIDGNKRIGLHVTLIFLELNGVDLKYT